MPNTSKVTSNILPRNLSITKQEGVHSHTQHHHLLLHHHSHGNQGNQNLLLSLGDQLILGIPGQKLRCFMQEFTAAMSKAREGQWNGLSILHLSG
ncbi:hypothetical protein BGX24_012119 [Mortierella sp. AD032]|nr:hypothetical protein BGX24_012119 [Mortierella sp. AD032]